MWIKILLLFFVFSFLFRTDFSLDQDLGRHLKLGEIISDTHSVPQINLFSYTNPDFPFVNTHWLFEFWAFWGNKLAGIRGLLVFKVLIFLLSVFLVLKTIPEENQALLLPIGFIFLHTLRERLELRPEVFSFLFTALSLYALDKFVQKPVSRSKFAVFFLPFIQLLWVNTHIYFFVGLVLQAIYLIHLLYQKLRFHLQGGQLKLLTVVFLLSICASLISPNGLTGFLYPLRVNQNYGYTIVENQTVFLLENIGFRDPNFLFVKISIGLVILGSLLALSRKSIVVKDMLLAGFGVGLALLNVRSFPYLFFLSFPPTLHFFGNLKANRASQFLVNAAALLLLLESFLYLNGSYYKYTDSPHQVGLKAASSVSGAMDFVLKNDLPGPIFNNFDIGSYIIYRGYPKYRVYVDGRPEAYPKEFFQNTYIPIQFDPDKFKQEDVKRGFKTIIFSHTDQTPWGRAFVSNIVRNPSWKLVYFDDFTMVLVKKDFADQHHLQPIDLSNLSSEAYNFDNHVSYLRIGFLLRGINFPESGSRFLRRVAVVFPAVFSESVKYFFW